MAGNRADWDPASRPPRAPHRSASRPRDFCLRSVATALGLAPRRVGSCAAGAADGRAMPCARARNQSGADALASRPIRAQGLQRQRWGAAAAARARRRRVAGDEPGAIFPRPPHARHTQRAADSSSTAKHTHANTLVQRARCSKFCAGRPVGNGAKSRIYLHPVSRPQLLPSPVACRVRLSLL